MRLRLLLAFTLVLLARQAQATTYYVRTDGNNLNAGTANTAGGAWQTITKGCQASAAGDTVRVQAGTYAETATSCTSGASASSTVTLVADGTVTTCGMSFASKSYIRVIGFTFDSSVGGCANNTIIDMTGTNTGLELWNNTASNTATNKKGLGTLNSTTDRCTKCIIFGNSISSIGGSTNGQTALSILGDDSFIGYNSLSTICYIGIGPGGSRLRLVNNNFSGMIQCDIYHPDFFYINGAQASIGWSNSLVESTFGIGTPTANNNKFHHQENGNAPAVVAWSDNVYRLNVAKSLGSGFYSVYTVAGNGADNLRTRFYNNTTVQSQRATSSHGNGSGSSQVAGKTVSVFIQNEVLYETWGTSITTNIDGSWEPGGGAGTTSFTQDYNLGYDPDGSVSFNSNWTNQVHEQTNVNPNLADVANNDFHLTAGSGNGANARGTGGPLTTATSCSGTTLNVAANTATYFFPDNGGNLTQYGGKLPPGDTITVGASTTRTIVSISGDAITVDSSLTCSNGDPVYFGSTSTIDMGAFPYKSTGYTLTATYTINAGTATITPNDASLVRFVICYDSAVPVTVANASPFTCPVGSGTFSAVVYPRYASQTQSVTASLSNGGGGKPRMRVRGGLDAPYF